MWLWNVPRAEIAETLIKKSGGLPKNPGEEYKGECDLFQAPKRGDAEPTKVPVCLGQCKNAKNAKGRCHLAIIAWEASHSDVYDVGVFCTCMNAAELEKWAKAKNGEVIEIR